MNQPKNWESRNSCKVSVGGGIRPRVERSHSCCLQTAWCVLKNVSRKWNEFNSKTQWYSILYLNLRAVYTRLKYMYSVMSVIAHLLPANTRILNSLQSTCFSLVLLPRVKKSHQAGIYIFPTCAVNSGLWRHGVIRGPVSNFFDLTRNSSPRHKLPPPCSCTGLHIYRI